MVNLSLFTFHFSPLKERLMTPKNIFKSIIALAVALPMSLSAQVDVNREKYPDYSDSLNPDWTLMPQQGAKKAQRADAATRSLRPAYVKRNSSRPCSTRTVVHAVRHHE